MHILAFIVWISDSSVMLLFCIFSGGGCGTEKVCSFVLRSVLSDCYVRLWTCSGKWVVGLGTEVDIVALLYMQYV